MAEPGQSVGRALDGAGKLDNGERGRDVEPATKHPCRDLAFPLIRGVLGIYQADDGIQRVLRIGAPPLRDFDRRGEP